MNQEISFSFSREAMLKRCLREYYLHVFYAYGEYDVESADHERNHVHLLKQLKTEKLFKESLINENLRKIFIDGMSFSNLKHALRNDFFAAKDAMMLGSYEYDHLAFPILKDFYYEEKNLADLFTNIAEDLSIWCDRMFENDLLNKLFSVPHNDFYPICDVASARIGRIKVYFPLVGIIKQDGFFYCLDFCHSEDFYDSAAVLHLLYCQQNLHMPPEKIRHVFLDETYILTLYDNNKITGISQFLNDIAERSAEHHALSKNMDAFTTPFALPAADKDKCRSCRFREFCTG